MSRTLRPRHIYVNDIYSFRPWVTVVETRAFVVRAVSRLTDAEREALVEVLARDPMRGDLIPGTGGIRKVRFGVRGRGKSGGVRVIYYFHSARFPLYLLTLFTKNEKSDLSQAERNALAKAVRELLPQGGS